MRALYNACVMHFYISILYTSISTTANYPYAFLGFINCLLALHGCDLEKLSASVSLLVLSIIGPRKRIAVWGLILWRCGAEQPQWHNASHKTKSRKHETTSHWVNLCPEKQVTLSTTIEVSTLVHHRKTWYTHQTRRLFIYDSLNLPA